MSDPTKNLLYQMQDLHNLPCGAYQLIGRGVQPVTTETFRNSI
jgi:hypothetical protein